MSTVGGELNAMLALRQAFATDSEAVLTLMHRIRGQLDQTWWEGPAADRFREAWSTDFEPALGRLSEALSDAGGEVQRRHDALHTAGS